MNYLLTLFAVLAGSLTSARASVIICLDDPHDKRELVIASLDDPRVKTFNEDLDAFKKKLLPLKMRNLQALFGKPVKKENTKDFAFPTAERRGLGLSGIRYADEKLNKDHTDFHLVGDHAALEIYYGIDGETPMAIVIYFKVDKQFIPLDHPDKFVQRLGWDRDKFQKMSRFCEEQQAKVKAASKP